MSHLKNLNPSKHVPGKANTISIQPGNPPLPVPGNFPWRHFPPILTLDGATIPLRLPPFLQCVVLVLTISITAHSTRHRQDTCRSKTAQRAGPIHLTSKASGQIPWPRTKRPCYQIPKAPLRLVDMRPYRYHLNRCQMHVQRHQT